VRKAQHGSSASAQCRRDGEQRCGFRADLCRCWRGKLPGTDARGILSVGRKYEVSRKNNPSPTGKKKPLKLLSNAHSHTLLVLRVAIFIALVVSLSV